MTYQELTHLYETHIHNITPYIKYHAASMSRMEGHEKEDLEQFARMHVWETLQKRPESKAAYLKVAAKHKMLEEQGQGKSVDRNSYRRKKPTQVLRLDHHTLPDGRSLLNAIPAERWMSLEDQVINKVCLERFQESLTAAEDYYAALKVKDDLSDVKIMRKTGWTMERIYEMKWSIAKKMDAAFAE